MRLSEYIKGLKETLKEHGDLECYAASDAEGNSYNKVYHAGTRFFTTEDLTYSLEGVYSSQEEYDDDQDQWEDAGYEPDEREELTPICIVN